HARGDGANPGEGERDVHDDLLENASTAPAQGGCPHGGTPEREHVGVGFADADGDTGHVEAGHVVADQVGLDTDAFSGQGPRHGGVRDVELDQGSAAHAVDHDDGVVSRGEVVVAEDLLHGDVHEF